MDTTARWKTAALGSQILLLATLLGCGGSGGVPRLPVYGTITDPAGDKIDGSISFIPDQGKPGPGAVTSLVQGHYRFDASNGPTEGPHRVIVTRAAGKEKTLRRAAEIAKSRPADRKAPLAASRTNEWKFSATVSAKGPHQFDFTLQ